MAKTHIMLVIEHRTLMTFELGCGQLSSKLGLFKKGRLRTMNTYQKAKGVESFGRSFVLLYKRYLVPPIRA